MDRLIAVGSVDAAHADAAPAVGTPGFATDGNPATNTLATQWPAYQYNAIQEELMAVVEGAEIVPDRNTNTQVRAAIQAMIAAAITSLGGVASVSIAGSTTTTLSTAQAANGVIVLTGAVTAAKAVTVPAASGKWTVKHSGTGWFPVTLKTPAGTGIVLFPGDCMDLWSDGTNVYQTSSSLPRIYPITSLPTVNVGSIVVAGTGETWDWVSTAYFTGYRSPLCGRAIFGHTSSPLSCEIDAVGGTVSKTAYAALWAYAGENGLIVSAANWAAGTHFFVDVDASTFKVPDLRNQFMRFTGTDADTANARATGTHQIDAFASHRHTNAASSTANGQSGGAVTGAGSGSATSTGNTGGAETRPINTAFPARIHA
jgi:hypothetical protein